MRYLYTMIAALGLLLLGTMPAAADHVHYPEAPWTAIDTDDGTGDPYPGAWVPGLEAPSENSEITGQHTATLKWPDEGPNLGTSIETLNLGLDVEPGAEVSVSFELVGPAECSLGAPRVFVIVSGTQYNSDDNCNGSLTIPDGGTIGHAGISYDNGVKGKVRVSDLVIDGHEVSFLPEPEPEVCEHDDSLTADDPECKTDDGKDDEADEDAKNEDEQVDETDDESESTSDDDTTPASTTETLPNTGVSLLWLVGGGIVLVLAGGAMALRRRTQ